MTSDIKQAAEAIAKADAILIGAGAGMGVDSGLPDFRGNKSFWRAYPPFKEKSFAEISHPRWFRPNRHDAHAIANAGNARIGSIG